MNLAFFKNIFHILSIFLTVIVEMNNCKNRRKNAMKPKGFLIKMKKWTLNCVLQIKFNFWNLNCSIKQKKIEFENPNWNKTKKIAFQNPRNWNEIKNLHLETLIKLFETLNSNQMKKIEFENPSLK